MISFLGKVGFSSEATGSQAVVHKVMGFGFLGLFPRKFYGEILDMPIKCQDKRSF